MEDRIGYLLKRAQQLLRLKMDAELHTLNLTTAQYAALSALEQNPNASNAALARACFVTPQTMIEIVQGLENLGFITRQSHPEHGRIIQTIITPSGQKKLTSAHHVVSAIEQKMVTGLKADEKNILQAYLQTCCDNLESQ